MRPLRLEMTGLRSFRATQPLDFTGLSLFAVIGDTGAGKSSILEAIVFALYAGSTWDARGGGALRSLDADAMSVTLDFSVGGKRYRVKRVVFRSTRPSEHALSSPDDPEYRFAGERMVNAEIRRLVGLDYDTFKKTVVLPQGRFAALLEMSDADRSRVLTELLGLDQIDRLREKLEPARQEAGARKRDALARRGELGADPEAEVARLDEAARAARSSLDAMAAARNDLSAKAAALARSAERANALETVERELATILSTAERVRALAPEHARLQTEQKALGGRRTQLQAELLAATTEPRTLEQERRDAASIVGFIGDVKRLRDDAASLGLEAAELEAREGALQEEEAALQSASAALVALREQAELAQAALREAESRRDDARERTSLARETWRAWVQADLALESARAELAMADADLRTEAERQGALEAAVTSADTAYGAARDALETAERADRAAALAHELHAGEPCPVCRRQLPDGFAAPAVPDVVAAKGTFTRAERDREKARAAYEGGRASLAALERNRVARDSARAGKAREREAAEKALLAMGLAPSAAGDGDALKAMREQYSDLSAQADAATKRRDAEHGAFVNADADVKARVRTQAAALKAHRSAKQAHAKRAGLSEQVRLGLPETFRPAQAAKASAYAKIVAALDDARAHAAAVGSKQATLAKNLAEIEGQLREAGAAYQRTIADPSVAGRHALDRSVAAIGPSVKASELTAVPVRTGDDFGVLVGWGERLAGWCEQTRGDVEIRREAASAEYAVLDAALAGILRLHGVETAEAFEGRFVERTAEVAIAVERLRVARENAERASSLDRELLELEPVVSALEQLQRYLQNRAFKDFVMRRRERRLLGIGTEILRGMTGERYAFAEGFDILDRHADRVRSPKTLSGGETFLASLALALALVEVASRAGGKLDALFLDEGFGNLDAATLDDALSELAERAKSGKMIGIVTHVRGIAEQIDTVLRVERRASGSVIERLEGSALADFMEDEVRTGLLGAVKAT